MSRITDSDIAEVLLALRLQALPILPHTARNPALRAAVADKLMCFATELQVHPFSFNGRGGFEVRGGTWTPGAMQPALALWITAHTGHWVYPGNRSAVCKALDRQIESLARTDLALANAVAFGHGDTPGLHVKRHPRYGGLMVVRWQRPPGFRLGPPAPGHWPRNSGGTLLTPKR